MPYDRPHDPHQKPGAQVRRGDGVTDDQERELKVKNREHHLSNIAAMQRWSYAALLTLNSGGAVAATHALSTLAGCLFLTGIVAELFSGELDMEANRFHQRRYDKILEGRSVTEARIEWWMIFATVLKALSAAGFIAGAVALLLR